MKKAADGMMYCKVEATLFYWLKSAVIYPLIGLLNKLDQLDTLNLRL